MKPKQEVPIKKCLACRKSRSLPIDFARVLQFQQKKTLVFASIATAGST